MYKETYLQKIALNKPFVEGLKKLVPGAIGGAAATMIVMPIDTTSDVQKIWRSMPNHPALNRAGRSFRATASELYKPKIRTDAKGGADIFYTGAAGKLMKVVPSTAFTYAIADALMKSKHFRAPL